AEVAVDVAGADEAERLLAVQRHAAGGQVDPRVAVSDRLVEVEVDAAEGVDDVDEAGEVHLDVVLDRDAGQLGDRLDEAVGAADAALLPHGVGAVDLADPALAVLDAQVPREAQHRGVVTPRAELEQHDRVGQPRAVVLGAERAELLLGEALAAVVADDEDVHDLLDLVDLDLLLGGGQLAVAVEVAGADGAVLQRGDVDAVDGVVAVPDQRAGGGGGGQG